MRIRGSAGAASEAVAVTRLAIANHAYIRVFIGTSRSEQPAEEVGHGVSDDGAATVHEFSALGLLAELLVVLGFMDRSIKLVHADVAEHVGTESFVVAVNRMFPGHLAAIGRNE